MGSFGEPLHAALPLRQDIQQLETMRTPKRARQAGELVKCELLRAGHLWLSGSVNDTGFEVHPTAALPLALLTGRFYRGTACHARAVALVSPHSKRACPGSSQPSHRARVGGGARNCGGRLQSL